MRILGLDPATRTGWALVDYTKAELEEFGRIQCPQDFTLPQKLNFFHVEVTRLLERLKPDYMAIEDVILAISGARTLVYLARINGVIIQASYQYLKNRVYVYDPNTWKSNSIAGIDSKSPKWRTQLEVCRQLNIPLVGEFSDVDKRIEHTRKELVDLQNSLEDFRTEIDTLKKAIARKRNPLTPIEKEEFENKLQITKKEYAELKLTIKEVSKDVDKQLLSIGNDIYSQTGVSSDVADAVCLSCCLYRSLSEGK